MDLGSFGGNPSFERIRIIPDTPCPPPAGVTPPSRWMANSFFSEGRIRRIVSTIRGRWSSTWRTISSSRRGPCFWTVTNFPRRRREPVKPRLSSVLPYIFSVGATFPRFSTMFGSSICDQRVENCAGNASSPRERRLHRESVTPRSSWEIELFFAADEAQHKRTREESTPPMTMASRPCRA